MNVVCGLSRSVCCTVCAVLYVLQLDLLTWLRFRSRKDKCQVMTWGLCGCDTVTSEPRSSQRACSLCASLQSRGGREPRGDTYQRRAAGRAVNNCWKKDSRDPQRRRRKRCFSEKFALRVFCTSPLSSGESCEGEKTATATVVRSGGGRRRVVAQRRRAARKKRPTTCAPQKTVYPQSKRPGLQRERRNRGQGKS